MLNKPTGSPIMAEQSDSTFRFAIAMIILSVTILGFACSVCCKTNSPSIKSGAKVTADSNPVCSCSSTIGTASNFVADPRVWSVFAALLAIFFGILALKTNALNEYQKMLLEWNKEVIKTPLLAAANDVMHAKLLQDEEKKDDLESFEIQVKLRHFCYMKLNTFEAVFLYNSRLTTKLVSFGRRNWAVWERFFQYQMVHSTMFREICAKDDLAEYYPIEFVTLVQACLEASQERYENAQKLLNTK
jgi:hypothetical protein